MGQIINNMFTDNPDFYPTPKSLAQKMAGMIDIKFSGRMLEPSAGKGDLVDAIIKRYDTYFNRKVIDCIEPDLDLQNILSSKENCRIIDSDFLTYTPSKQYDTIIMNPPFSNGVKHVLKAWEIIYNGDVIALLNAETIRNPFSKERQLLAEIIKDFGKIEYIQDAFKDAQRKTGVEVVLIHLKKRNDVRHDYFSDLQKAKDIAEPEFQKSELAIPNSQIENSVIAYNKAIETQKQSIIKSQEADYYASMIKKNDKPESGQEITEKVKESLNTYVENLRESAWSSIVHMADFHRNMTERVQTEINQQIDVVKKLEFTVDNICKFLNRLLMNQGDIMNQCVLDVYDMFTKYYPENRVHIEGWKSNDVFFVGRRVVLPYFTEPNYSGGYTVHYNARRKLADIDRVAKLIVGNCNISLHDIAEKNHKGLTNEKYVTDHFSVRFYKKGTMHLYFDNKKLLDNLNLIVGRQRGWIPKANEQVPKEFWLMNK